MKSLWTDEAPDGTELFILLKKFDVKATFDALAVLEEFDPEAATALKGHIRKVHERLGARATQAQINKAGKQLARRYPSIIRLRANRIPVLAEIARKAA